MTCSFGLCWCCLESWTIHHFFRRVHQLNIALAFPVSTTSLRSFDHDSPYMLTIVPRSTSFVNQQCWLNHVKSLSHVITGYRITYTPRDINKSPRIPTKNIQIHLSLSYFLRSSFSFSSEIGWALPMWFVSTPSSAWLAVAATSSDAGFLAVYCAVKWGLLELNMQVLYLYKHVWPETANEDMRKLHHIMEYHGTSCNIINIWINQLATSHQQTILQAFWSPTTSMYLWFHGPMDPEPKEIHVPQSGATSDQITLPVTHLAAGSCPNLYHHWGLVLGPTA